MIVRFFLTQCFSYIIFISYSQSAKNEDLINYPPGGYDFPASITDKDSGFCWYPVKERMEPRDSIYTAFMIPYILKSFHEPNLSLRPQKEVEFRLLYIVSTGVRPEVIIILKPNEIIVKEGKTGNAVPYTDISKLTEKEQKDLNLFELYFPLYKRKTHYSKYRNIYLDTLMVKQPNLLDPGYFWTLLEKGKSFNETGFTYETRKIAISGRVYRKLVSSINASGYWNQEYQFPCNNHPFDGCSYILEANTSQKYNVVQLDDCEHNNSKLAQAYQLLVDAAGMRSKIKITTL